MIRAVDVHVGDFYRVSSGATETIVQILERVASCWLCRNTATGRDRYVCLGDLIAKVDGPAPAAAVEPNNDRQHMTDHARSSSPWWLND